ncbi:glycosyltransferase family 2 protein [Rosenbergiella collisarenosi]|uniref:glycosyltransferase family 2 protein n=1 Tax=Rosenbergiella collisarenosi TaxID=1544695 RepID=UPI001F4E03F5|nr:glycosyltransferase family 2 protein [Rosenbergiella collisarenosi]
MNIRIGIALATYNGSKYIEVMLDSIRKQSYQEFHVHICDDGSTDNTISVIKDTQLYKDGKITIHCNDGGHGAMRNFRRSIEFCNEGYIVLCDQDDFWVDDKLEIMLNRMLKQEEKYGIIPLLVFSDLDIVDANLNTMHSSFFKASIKNSSCKKPQDFMINNHVPGCAMMFNHKSKSYFEPIPESTRMHDWWIIFIISLYGQIDFEEMPLIKYRQHDNNTIGVPGINKKSTIYEEVNSIRYLPSALAKSKKMKDDILNRISKICTDELSSSGRFFYENINSGTMNRIKLFKNSVSGERFLLSLLIWFFL